MRKIIIRLINSTILMAVISCAHPVHAQDAGLIRPESALTTQERGGKESEVQEQFLFWKSGNPCFDIAQMSYEQLAKEFPGDSFAQNLTAEAQTKLFPYCQRLFSRREYSKTIACINALDRGLRSNGDIPIVGSSLVSRNSLSAKNCFWPLAEKLPPLKRQIYLELGDVDSAIKVNDVPKIKISNQSASVVEAVLAVRSKSTIPAISEIDEYATKVIVAHLAGNGELRQKSLDALHDMEPSIFNKAAREAYYAAMGRVMLALEDYKAAEKYLGSTTASSTIANAAASAVVGIAAVALGTSSPKNIKDAIEMLGGSAKLAVNAVASGKSIYSKFQRAHVRTELGEIQSAKAELDDILADPDIKLAPNIYWAALYDRGRIAEIEGDFERAIDYLRLSIEEIERIRSNINTEGSRIGFFGDKQNVYQKLAHLQLQSKQFEEAFLTTERSKARALVDLLANKKDFRLNNQDAEKVSSLLETRQATEASLAYGAQLPAELADDLRDLLTRTSEPDGHAAISSKVRSYLQRTESNVVALAPDLAPLVSVGKVSLSEIREFLPVGSALVSYYYDQKSLYAFVLTLDALKVHVLSREGLENDIATLRQAIQDGSAYSKPSQALYRRLIEPILQEIKTSRLIIAAHGQLHYLPFSSLSDGKDHLLDKFELMYLPSASTLKYIPAPDSTRQNGSVLVFGNPDIGDPRFDLPHAEKEASLVSRIFDKSIVFVRNEANKYNLMKYSYGFKYLHFAMHGTFDAKNPLQSALLMAKDSQHLSSGQLTINEVYSLRLNADLVTLSACETGLGKIGNGDEVIGLIRGFLYAGASNVIATLWEIDDEATAVLMEQFYRKLNAGMRKSEALRLAQIELRSKGYGHPKYWAGFQLTGGKY